jgi:energy-coupling factor transport system substrate-specific component
VTKEAKPEEIASNLAIAAVFAALVCVATIVFTISIPATSGYFNLGETVIYVAALLFGPYVSGLAGGVGAAIADMIVAAQFAPGTLVIKGIEGMIVGFLNRKISLWTARPGISAIIAVVVGGLEMVAGYFLYENLVLNYSVAAAVVEVPFNIVQMLVGLIIAIPVARIVLRIFPQLKR